MVARSGRGWHLAPCLVAMEDEADRLAPNRNRKADGSIGDQAHQSRTSDHNPSDGYVHALDLTHDPAGGFDCNARVAQIVRRQDPRIKYIIFNRQVWRSYKTASHHPEPWTPAPYGGSNPHTFHAHFSVIGSDRARHDTSSWWPTHTPTPPPEDPFMADIVLSGADLERIVENTYAEAGKGLDKSGRASWPAALAFDDDPKGVLNYIRHALGLKPIA